MFTISSYLEVSKVDSYLEVSKVDTSDSNLYER